MDLQTLEANSEKIPFSGCWIWMKGLNGGYAWQGRSSVHVQAYRALRGEIPKGKFVCHTCDVPSCVNPQHLFLGTAKENSVDMAMKERSKRNTKLSVAQVREIKALLGQHSQSELARRYKVDPTTIGAISRGRNWKNI